MNFWDWFILGIIVIIVAAAVFFFFRNRKKGCGCGCEGCTKNCSDRKQTGSGR